MQLDIKVDEQVLRKGFLRVLARLKEQEAYHVEKGNQTAAAIARKSVADLANYIGLLEHELQIQEQQIQALQEQSKIHAKQVYNRGYEAGHKAGKSIYEAQTPTRFDKEAYRRHSIQQAQNKWKHLY